MTKATLTRGRWPALVALALLVGACTNPFKPADPELPDATSVVEDFRDPDLVLETMAAGVVNRSQNGANAFLHAYAESTQAGDRAFRAYYDEAVGLNWQGSTQITPPEPWDLSLERNVHAYISGLRPTYIYTWVWSRDDDSPENEDFALADTVLWHKKYQLFATSPDGNTTETIVVGYADLSFQKKEGRWSIFRWVDRVDPTVGVVPARPDERCMSWWRLESLVRR